MGAAHLQPVRGVPERADRAELDGAPQPPRSEQAEHAEEEEEAGFTEIQKTYKVINAYS